MKLLVLILVLAIAIKTSNAEPCGFCPNGVEFPDEEVYDDDTKVTFKCSSLGVIAMSLEDDDETCEKMKYATEICCPSQFLPCSFCPSGVVDANTTVPESNGNTCGSLAAAAATIPDSLQVCNEIKMAHALCCPNDIVSGSCSFCETSGIIDPNLILENGDGFTCGQAKAYASSLDGDSDDCADVKFAQAACCPDECQGGCPFCPNGVNDPTFFIGDANLTCGELSVL